MSNEQEHNQHDSGPPLEDVKTSSPGGVSEKKAGRRKINIEFIEDKSRRHITFSKRKAGLMKKAYELSTLTGTQTLLLVASETGHVYTFATPKLQPLITKPEGKNLIQACLNSPDNAQPAQSSQASNQNYQDSALIYPAAEPLDSVYDEDKKDSKSFPSMGVEMGYPQHSGYPPGNLISPVGMSPVYATAAPMNGGPAMQTRFLPPAQAYPSFQGGNQMAPGGFPPSAQFSNGGGPYMAWPSGAVSPKQQILPLSQSGQSSHAHQQQQQQLIQQFQLQQQMQQQAAQANGSPPQKLG